MAAALFNWTIDVGLDLCAAQASAEIRIGSVEEVAPLLLKRILNRLPDDRMLGNAADHTSPTCVVQRFLPLVPVLTMLKETIESPGWVQNQLALRGQPQYDEPQKGGRAIVSRTDKSGGEGTWNGRARLREGNR